MAKGSFNDASNPVLTATKGTPNIQDGSVYNTNATTRNAANLSASSTNEAVFMVSGYLPDTVNGDFEKIGVYSVVGTEKQASPTTLAQDAVGADLRGIILPNNPKGRAWGLLASTQVLTTGDGYAIAAELEVINRGSSEFSPGTALSKYGANIVAKEGFTTAGIRLTRDGISANNRMHWGIYCDDGTILTSSAGAVLRVPNSVSAIRIGSGLNSDELNVFDLEVSDTLAVGRDAPRIAMTIESVGFRVVQAGGPNSAGSGYRQLRVLN